jgi:dihydroxy-acid dehydratase
MANKSEPETLRSRAWFGGNDMAGFVHRAYLRAEGFTRHVFDGKPVIGICNSWSELTTCNSHLRTVAEAVKRGVWEAGGFPLEFPTISLGEILMKPTTMLFRNLMAMDVEECIRAYPLDAVVLLPGCDKTTPAQLMGAASADVPAIVVPGGPMLNGMWRGQKIGSGTDTRRFWAEKRAGNLTDEQWCEIEGCLSRSAGHCMVMGTASTMTSLTEALGMTLPGCANIPAADSHRLSIAEESGKRAVEMAREGLRPSRILTPEAFDNAIRVNMAIGGSTNAIIHLVAIAGRLGIDLPLERFDQISREVPVIANIRPSGSYLMEDLYYAGGLPAVMETLRPMLHLNALTVSGRTLGEDIAGAECFNRDVIRSLDSPIQPEGGTVILHGNIAPNGAVLKQSAATSQLLKHKGKAVVFTDYADLKRRIDAPDLDVDENSVLVLQNSGPKGGPGMPEWGDLPIPEKLLKVGVKDILRLSDARMSGTAYGTVVLHISPESAVGGPLAIVRDGDWIELDVRSRRLELLVPQVEIESRLAQWQPPPPHYQRGYGSMYLKHILQADQGCDFDYLRASAEPVKA